MNKLSPAFCPAIIIMAKAPRAGLAKTRLQPFLTEEQAADLSSCFLKDTVKNARQAASNVILAFTPAGGQREIAGLFTGQNLFFTEQKGGDFGERLRSAIAYAGIKNFAPIIVIGADSPTLPLEYIQTAIKSFASSETNIVLGAASDGGFYLVGTRKNHSGIFDNVAWSTASVFEQTRQNIRRLGLSLNQLPVWYDIDTPADLFRLRREMLGEENFRFRAPETFKWLMRHSRLFDMV